MKMQKTKSWAPLVLGILGGLWGIFLSYVLLFLAALVGGLFETKVFIVDFLVIATATLSISGIILGIISRFWKFGSFLQLIAGALLIVCFIIALFFKSIFWPVLITATLFSLGGVIGMLKPKDAIILSNNN